LLLEALIHNPHSHFLTDFLISVQVILFLRRTGEFAAVPDGGAESSAITLTGNKILEYL
jgi:hypothetical protein